MTRHDDLLFSETDAEMLSALVDARGRLSRPEAEAADALAGELIGARVVPDEALPADRVAMRSRVAYREEPGGVRRTVTLVHPSLADSGASRISVFSPVGRALLGRTSGTTAEIAVPGGRSLTLRVIEVAGREARPRGAGFMGDSRLP